MRPEQALSPERLLGLPAVEVVKYIFANTRMRGSLIRYHYEPGLPSASDYLFIPFDKSSNINSLLDEHLLSGYDIGIYSKVERADGSYAHIPMIDFELRVGAENFAKIKQRLAQFFLRNQTCSWVILDSGNCYQAYCLDQILPVEKNDEYTILRFAEECHRVLDFNDGRTRDEITHGWWFTHSAAKGGTVLRLTRNRPELKKKIPEVVAVVSSVSK